MTTNRATHAGGDEIISISHLSKTYNSGYQALKDVGLQIRKGEIFALLGPNGAGKTTLISIICGLVRPSGGRVLVGGYDIAREYRRTRAMIGLVPQELTVDVFISPWTTASLSRGLFGKPPNPAYIEKVLKDLSLWEKRDNHIMTLSGGMKRRVLIAKALAHEPDILFLDEPTAGVDVELRREMWQLVRQLRETGVTIILTTHYIEEAEDMADRIGVIHRGELVVVEEKTELMRKLGKKQLTLNLQAPIEHLPSGLEAYNLSLAADGSELLYTYDARAEATGIAALLGDLHEAGIHLSDLNTKQSSLEDIFVNLVEDRA
ncbi:MAG: ABC transporter ATP-binding protein [Acidihalobacter sp.]|uniref:ABC transporter ATP-binding protein n=1 Tax=Acidihalobacter sp. TaxID=1872108 RepID=UPI00307F68AD